MVRELIVTSLPGETRMALLEDREVVELGVERRAGQSVLHGIYRARVQRVVPGTQAAFLDLGLSRNAFLQSDQIPAASVAGAGAVSGRRPRIEDVLRPGQAVLVQVVREPLGPKGYKVSCNLRLQGRFLDFRPFAPPAAIVRRTGAGPREELRLTALVERRATVKGEWAARAAAGQIEEETLAADIARIEADWLDIRSQGTEGPPACVRSEISMVFRYVRDVLSSGFDSIRVDDENLYARLLNFVRQVLPGLEHRIRYYSRNYPIFHEYGVEKAFRQATRRRIRLPSGGSIVIDPTEALVAVDVNTGSFSGETGGRDETNTLTNLEAAAETARQLRLRGLGGIIVIDFIDMRDRANQMRVFRALQGHLRRDPAFTRSSPPEPRAGLVVVTRKRERPSLDAAVLAACPACRGAGRVPSQAAVCQQILTRVQKRARDFASGVRIEASPQVAATLRRSAVLAEIARVLAGPVEVHDSPRLPEPRFELRSPVGPDDGSSDDVVEFEVAAARDSGQSAAPAA